MPDVTRPLPVTAARRAPRRPSPGSNRVTIGIIVAGLVAGAFAANTLVARRTEQRHPARGRFVEVDGVRIHYLEQGQGSPIVLIHGNGVMAEDYRLSGLLDRLAEQHRVVAFDRPGFGYSERPRSKVWTAHAQSELLFEAMRLLGIVRPVVVGHSWGTLVTMTMALDHAPELAGIVLMSGYYFPTPRLDVVTSSGPAIPVLGDAMRYTVSPLLGWLIAPLVFKQVFAPSPVTANFKAGFPVALTVRPSQIRASAGDTALMIPDAAKTAGRHQELVLPVLIIAGTDDKIVSFAHQSEQLAAQIPGSELHAVAGAGHMIHHTAPQEVAAAIEEFVAGQSRVGDAAFSPNSTSNAVGASERV